MQKVAKYTKENIDSTPITPPPWRNSWNLEALKPVQKRSDLPRFSLQKVKRSRSTKVIKRVKTKENDAYCYHTETSAKNGLISVIAMTDNARA